MVQWSLWMMLTIAGPVILIAALVYALFFARKLTPQENSELRAAKDEFYVDSEEEDGCVARVDTEKRHPDLGTPTERRFREAADTAR